MLFSFGIKDAIDVLIVSMMLYQSYRLMKNTGAVNIFVGILFFIVFWFLISRVFQLEMTGAILNQVVNVGAILLVVIFQNEIRSFFSRLGSHQRWKSYIKVVNFFKTKRQEGAVSSFPTMKLVMACRNMSRTKTGALIVIERHTPMTEYVNSGDRIDALISTRLIENIFFKNSPLHDGAMIISRDRIVAAGGILPVSKNPEIPRHLGLRHRAAMGVSEVSDALVIIVSEETGTISVAVDGGYRLNLSAEDLERLITEELQA